MSSNRSKSGKVKTTLPTAVSADRYSFIQLSDAEPNLGVPAQNNYVLASQTDGTRSWVQSATPQGITFVGDDSTGTLISDGETIKVAGGNNVTVAMSGDILTITGSTDINVNTISSTDSTAIQINDGVNVSGTLTAPIAVINRISTSDSSDINISGAPVNFGSGGEVMYKESASLNDLAGVELESVQIDQFLRFNGANWVNATGATLAAGPGVTFFYQTPVITAADTDNDHDIITMATTVGGGVEQQVIQTANNSTEIVAAFVSGTLNRTVLDSGYYSFHNHASVDTGAGVTTIKNIVYTATPFATGTVTLTGSGTSRTATASTGNPFATASVVASATNTDASYLQTTNGLFQITSRASDTVVTVTTPSGYTNESAAVGTVWKKYFESTQSSVISSTSITQYNTESTQVALNVGATVKLGIILFMIATSAAELTYYYDGTDNTSSVTTPFGSLHNSLGGLQGGTATEFYHLTSSEYTGTGTGVFVRTSSPSIASATLTGTTNAATLVTNEISSSDSTAIQVNDAINISGAVTAATSLSTPSIVTNAISSGDSSVVTINDDLEVKSQLFVNTISSNDSTRVVIADGVRISGLNYPTADGSNGQVITTDGAGGLTFQSSGGAGSGSADSVTFTGFGSNNAAVTDENVFGYVALDQSFGTAPSALDAISHEEYQGAFYYVLAYNNVTGVRSMGSASLVVGNTASSAFDAVTGGGGGVVDGAGDGLSYSASLAYPTATLFVAGDSSVNTASYYRVSLGTALVAGTVGDTQKLISSSIGTTLATADTWAYANFRGAKYYITVVSTDTGEASNIEALVVHDGVSAYITNFNEIFSENNSLISLSADISGANVRLRASCNGPCVLYMHRILLADSEAVTAPNAYEKTLASVNVTGSTYAALDSYDYQDYAYSGAFYLVTAHNSATGVSSVSEVYLATNGTTTSSVANAFVSSKGSNLLEFDATIDSDGLVSLMAASTESSGTTVCSIYRVALSDPPEALAFKTMDTFDKTLFRGSRYSIAVWSQTLSEGNQFDVQVTHNGTTAFVAQYGWITTGNTYAYPGFITVDADISGQNVILKGVSTGEGTLRITMARHRIPI